jgi:hypothetical protein
VLPTSLTAGALWLIQVLLGLLENSLQDLARAIVIARAVLADELQDLVDGSALVGTEPLSPLLRNLPSEDLRNSTAAPVEWAKRR